MIIAQQYLTQVDTFYLQHRGLRRVHLRWFAPNHYPQESKPGKVGQRKESGVRAFYVQQTIYGVRNVLLGDNLPSSHHAPDKSNAKIIPINKISSFLFSLNTTLQFLFCSIEIKTGEDHKGYQISPFTQWSIALIRPNE